MSDRPASPDEAQLAVEADHYGTAMDWQWASEIPPERPYWLWPRWLCRARLHNVVGRTGSGKSTLTTGWLPAQLSRGCMLPGDDYQNDPCCVAVLSLEEPRGLTARLAAFGADMDQVAVVGGTVAKQESGPQIDRAWVLPADVPALERMLVDIGADVVVIDGIGYTAQGDGSYASVGSALTALAKMAERTDCAVVGVIHPPKGKESAQDGPAIGSVAWTTVARITRPSRSIRATPEQDLTKKRRLLAVGPTNFKRPSTGYAFHLCDGLHEQAVLRDGLVATQVDHESLLSMPPDREQRSQAERARDFLREYLGDPANVDDEGWASTADIYPAAANEQIPARTLRDAREGVVEDGKRKGKGKDHHGTWRLLRQDEKP